MMEKLLQWQSLIGVVVAVVAIIYNNSAALNREKRKETRSLVDSISKQIVEVESKAIKFHSSENFDLEKSFDLTHQIERVSLSIQRSSALRCDLVYGAITDWTQSISLKNFDLSNFQQQAFDSPICLNIFDRSQALISEIEDAYTFVYPL